MGIAIFNVVGFILLILCYVLFGFESTCLAILYLIYVELRYVEE